MDALPIDGEIPHSSSGPLVARYERLRGQLRELSSAPVRDMPAIDQLLAEIDEVHAAFKASHSSGIDHQRY